MQPVPVWADPQAFWPPLTDLAPQAESHLPGVSLNLLPLGNQLPNVSMTFQAWRSLSVSVGWWSGAGKLEGLNWVVGD